MAHEHQQQFADDEDDAFDVDGDGNVLADGEVLRIPLMMSDGQTVDAPLRVGADGRAHVQVPALDGSQRIAAAQQATAGPLVYHKVPTIDAALWTDAEQARSAWLQRQQNAWRDNRSTHLPSISNTAVRTDAIKTDSQPPNTTNVSDSDKAYSAYCRRLEDGWKRGRPDYRG